MKVIINGKTIETNGKNTLLEVARENGISIPSLCDHPDLIPFTGCRLCLVQIEGRRGFLPSCSTFPEEGMKVKTHTPKLRKLRKQILELILSEHPNACLICQEKDNCDEKKSTIRKVGETTGCVLCPNNGRCQLQDVVEEIGIDRVSFPSVYRDLEIQRGDPFFDRNFNLCILCGRCVRICREVRGLSTLTFVQRGPETVVGTALGRSLRDSNCQFCGACVDVCPTGALTEKAIKYDGLPSETKKTICPLCSMGCEMEVTLREGQLIGFQPSANGSLNQGQACVKGRFTLRDIVTSSRRLEHPRIRVNKELEEVTWDQALDFVAAGFKKFKRHEIAVVGSSQVSCENAFALQQFANDVLKTGNVIQGEGLSPQTAAQDVLAGCGLDLETDVKINEISQAKVIFLLGTNIAVSQPLVWLETLKAVKAGAKLLVAGSSEYLFERYASLVLRIKPGTEALLLRTLSKLYLCRDDSQAASDITGAQDFIAGLEATSHTKALETIDIEEAELRAALRLLESEGPAWYLFGEELTSRAAGPENVASLWNLSLQTQARLFPLGTTCNQRALAVLGAASRNGTEEAIQKALQTREVKALYLAGPFSLPPKAKLEFLVIQDSYSGPLADKADVILPTTTWAEEEGTYINAEGRVQATERLIEPLGDARPDWWVYTQLSRKMTKHGWTYKRASEVWNALRRKNAALKDFSTAQLKKSGENFLSRKTNGRPAFLPVKPTNGGIKATKRYPLLLVNEQNLDAYKGLSLSEDITGFRFFRDEAWVKVHPGTAEALGLENGDVIELESAQGMTAAVLKLSTAVPEGLAQAALSWSRFARKPGGNIFPVNIKRGHE
jgi:predicted molibdopterin-dependent oxidoreductase YjgC